RLPGRRRLLVLSRSLSRESRAWISLPHLPGTRLLRSSNTKPLYPLRPAQPARIKIPSRLPEHRRAAARRNVRDEYFPISFVRWDGLAALRGFFHAAGLLLHQPDPTNPGRDGRHWRKRSRLG